VGSERTDALRENGGAEKERREVKFGKKKRRPTKK